MCSPAIALLAVTAVQGYMQYQQAQAQAKSIEVTAENNSKIAEFNARQDEAKAADATDRGAQGAYEERQRARIATSTARAEESGGGFLADTGTNLDIQSQNMQTGEVNALTVMGNASREAYGFTSDAQSQRFGAKVGMANAGYQAAVTKSNGLLTGVGTFLTGAATYGMSGAGGARYTPQQAFSSIGKPPVYGPPAPIVWR